MDSIAKRANFKRLSESRLEEVKYRFQLIGNLANQSNYEYSETDIENIMNTLRKELFILENKFKNKKRQKYKIYNY